jgi:signal transduction histidine kinase
VMPRPVPWVAPLLYGAVLCAGVYYAAVGPGLGLKTAGYAGVLGVLIVLDRWERWPPPLARSVLRVLLLGLTAALDVSGLSRVLFVLVPFLAFFDFGPVAGVVLGVALVACMATAFTVAVPDWQVQAAYISDLLMFTLGVALAVVMADVAVREQRSRLLLEDTLAQVADLSAARERNRLTREIHDSLGHHLTAMSIQLEKAEAFTAIDPVMSARAVSSARWSANRALDEVRASVRAIGSESGPVDLSRALADLVHHLDGGARRISLSVSGTERRPLFVLYRAAQEGLTNACRHSGASEIRLSVAYDEQGARMHVADNGCGCGPVEEGFGLAGLRERIRLARGSVDLTTSAAGTCLSVSVPW